MDRPWIAEQAVDAELARALIESQFPELAPARVERLGVGWDNTVYRVNEVWAFRFPRRELAVDLIRAETNVLPWLASQLPLPISAPRFVGHSDERYPWPFAGCPYLPGGSASDLDLDDEQRSALAPMLGRFLRALHSVSVDEAAQRGAPEDRLGRLVIDRRTHQIEERLTCCVELGLIDDPTPLYGVAADVPPDWSYGPTHLVHGDLYARHLLVDGAGEATGVIDWGDIHRGHPAVDLGLAVGFLPPAARPAFVADYGPVPADTWRMARFKALHSACVILTYGADIGDAALIREGRRALGYLASSQPL